LAPRGEGALLHFTGKAVCHRKSGRRVAVWPARAVDRDCLSAWNHTRMVFGWRNKAGRETV